jgi:hypothetical protein
MPLRGSCNRRHPTRRSPRIPTPTDERDVMLRTSTAWPSVIPRCAACPVEAARPSWTWTVLGISACLPHSYTQGSTAHPSLRFAASDLPPRRRLEPCPDIGRLASSSARRKLRNRFGSVHVAAERRAATSLDGCRHKQELLQAMQHETPARSACACYRCGVYPSRTSFRRSKRRSHRRIPLSACSPF